MPRYHFHTAIGAQEIPDPDGIVLRDPDQAWEAARRMARALIEAAGADQARLLAAHLRVADEAGETVLEFPFAEALDGSGGVRRR